MRKPCDNCPWRKDAPVGLWHPSHFEDIWTGCQDDGLRTMLCHKATALPEDERGRLPCQGWARVMGLDAIGVRLALINETLTLEEVEDRDTPPLFESFEDMMEANGIPLPPRNRWTAPPGTRKRAKR